MGGKSAQSFNPINWTEQVEAARIGFAGGLSWK